MTEVLPITDVSFEPLEIALKRSAANAKNTWTSRSGVVVSVHAGGRVGYGECSPLPGFSPDDLDRATRDLGTVAARMRGAALPLDASAFDALDAIFAGIDVAALAPSARFAFETAILDLRARVFGHGLHRELGGSPEPPPVRLSALATTIAAHDVDASVEDAHRRGIDTLKVKVGRPGALADELTCLRHIRAGAGAGLRIRLDANGAWTPQAAAGALAAVAALGPEVVEEPVGGTSWLALEGSPVPLAIDETLGTAQGPAILDELLERRVCHVVVIKLAVVGGFSAAKRLVERAFAAGGDVIVTHMFEGPIASAAAAAFALSLPSRTFAAGLDVRTYLDLPADHLIGHASITAQRGAAGLGAH